MQRFILASRSPRRRDLLERAGYDFDVIASGADETPPDGEEFEVGDLAVLLAGRKARTISRLHPGRTVLGADTIVEIEGRRLGIPRDREESREMIEALQGRTHRVHTGIVVLAAAGEFRSSDAAEVRFRRLTTAEIEAYVASGEGDDKAGAYAYQGAGRSFIEAVVGDEQTVIGLPLKLVRAGFRELDLEPAS